MKRSERRLLIIFLSLAAIMGGVMASQKLLQWDHQLDRTERDLELAKMESDVLLGQSALWKARSEWITRTQPVASSGLDASKGLLDSLRHAAKGAGIDISKTQVEPEVATGYYRQFGVTLTLKGDLPKILDWIHSTQQPSDFFLIPMLKITPDKGDSQDVIVQVTFERRFTPEYAAVPGAKQGQLQPQGVAAP